SDITFPNSSGVILSITASTSGDATASRIVNVASTSSSLRTWRNRPIGQFPNFGSVYVFPFHSKVNTSSSVGVLRPCVFLTVMISPNAASKLHGMCWTRGARSAHPAPARLSNLSQRRIPLFHRGRPPFRGQDLSRWVGGNGHLVSNGLPTGVHLLADLGHFAFGNVRSNKIVPVDHVKDIRLAAAGFRRDDHYRPVRLDLCGV